MLNLDTEDWGEIFIGCAGGGDSMITLPVQHEALSASNADAYTITVSGVISETRHLQGPHHMCPTLLTHVMFRASLSGLQLSECWEAGRMPCCVRLLWLPR